MMGAKPLAGIRVLDFFWLIAGPLTSRTFANFGAEVIKVESSTRPDEIRQTGILPENAAPTDSTGVFNDCNTGKMAITLNLNHPKGKDLVYKLVKLSDIVTNNFTGDRMDRWGLGYKDLVKIKPDIIMITMPVMGTTGPYRRYGANGNGIPAGGGLTFLMGDPERPPVGSGPLYSDFSAPYHAATLLLSAIHYRNRTGRGQFIDLGQFPATVSLLGPAHLDYAANGVVASRNGNHSPNACPHEIYRCLGEDKWCAIAVETDDQWRRLCGVLGRPELAGDARFSTLAARKAHEREVDALVEAWIGERVDVEVMEQLQAAGVPAGVVQTIEDMVDKDPNGRGRYFDYIAYPSGNVYTTRSEPIKVAGEHRPVKRAPILAEHNDYVYRELLGLSEAEVAQLAAEGVLS